MMRKLKILSLILIVSIAHVASAEQNSVETGISVYRSPACECCGKWIRHLKDHGFLVKEIILENMAPIKKQTGVPNELVSCHTATVNGYVVEGHVPADDIRRMLKDKPEMAGIAVPGMPLGTPGMETAGRADSFKVISFNKENRYRVFKSYER